MRIRHHVNPLQSKMLEPRRVRLDLPADKEIEVEIGCADAQFLFERAALPDGASRCEVGLEIREDYVKLVNRRAAERGVDVRAFFSNVNVDLPYYFGDARVARVFVNFPDPYFKRAQHKRRVMTDGLVDEIWRILAPDGELYFASDVWDLALDAMDTVEQHDAQFENLAGAWSFWKQGNPFGVRSKRESDCQELGRQVWRMRYAKI